MNRRRTLVVGLLSLVSVPATAQMMPGSRRHSIGEFAVGTQMTFIQAVSPLGWIRVSTFDDSGLRIVASTTPSSGGTNGFSTVMAQTTVGNTTISTTTMPSHLHSLSPVPQNYDDNETGSGQSARIANGGSTSSRGSGGAHNHTLTMDMKYVDALLATKA